MSWTTPTLPEVFNTPQRPIDPLNPAAFMHLGPMTRDQALMRHEAAKKALDDAKQLEADLRRVCAKILTGDKPKEGMNNIPLENGYVAKVGIKLNYTLADDADKVEAALEGFRKISNEGAFIADRLVTWTPKLSLTELRKLEEEAGKSKPHAQMLAALQKVLTISEGMPTLEIKEPKGRK